MKLNPAGGLLQINVGSHHGPGLGAGTTTNNGGGGTWNYVMPTTPDGAPVTSTMGEDHLDVKLAGLHADITPDLTELKSLYPTTADYQLTNDPSLSHMPGLRGPTNNNNNNNNFNNGPTTNGSSPNDPSATVFDIVTSSTQLTPMLTSASAIKSELADYLLNSDIDDIAALIGNAIADSTVPTLGGNLDECGGVTSSTIDPWSDLDAWIESNCVIQQQQHQAVHSSSGNGPNNNNNTNNSHTKIEQDNTIHTSEFHPTLQTLLQQTDLLAQHQHAQQNQGIYQDGHPKNHHEQHFTSSILQSRLQQPPMRAQQDNHSQRHGSSPQHQLPESTTSLYGLKVDPYTPESPPFDHGPGGIGSSEIQRPHTTHVSPPAVVTSTMGRYRKPFNQRKNYDDFLQGPGGFPGDFTPVSGMGTKLGNGIKKRNKSAKLSAATANCHSMELIDNGKEKPIHRCGICNRGFLNKSNIKVHLRTHTGEKPFKCDTCGKAFRQKAHLLKHIQIHKRLPRD